MAKQFTVLISSTTDISLNDMGKLLNMIETRGIVIEEIHPENLLSSPEECGDDGVAGFCDLPEGHIGEHSYGRPYEPNDMPDVEDNDE